MNKLKALEGSLNKYRRVLVAFSGGVDSTFLLAFAARTLGRENVLAVTAVSETYSAGELKNATTFGKMIGTKHIFIKTAELAKADFKKNPSNRCYHCKLELFKKLALMAKKHGMILCDATNYSDRSDFRPGRIAARELNVESPILKARITKDELRRFSRSMKLPNWDAPAQACLASRIPYGTPISATVLKRIEKGEDYMMRALGLRVFRLRHHGTVARLEVAREEMKHFISKDTSALVSRLKKLGWRYVTLDLEGYRTGSMNPKAT